MYEELNRLFDGADTPTAYLLDDEELNRLFDGMDELTACLKDNTLLEHLPAME